MFPRVRGRSRYLLVAAAFAFSLFFLLPRLSQTSWTASEPARETEFLETYMNFNLPSQPKATSRSSFDWSKIKFRYAAQGERALPRRTGKLPKVQNAHWRESAAAAIRRKQRRNEVRALFKKNWASYRKYAWMKDALLPISAGYKDQFSGWAATLVDSLDTLWIMGLREEFDEAVAAVADIDFGNSTSTRVNLFETVIRYLGGLMGAYDLSKREILLTKAVELGDLLYAGFNTPNRMPVDFIEFEDAKTGAGLEVEESVVSASPGTLSLEFTHLSQLTGDAKYYQAAYEVMEVFSKGQQKTRLPGMWPVVVSMRNKEVAAGSFFTVGGSADSLYEYLPKMVALLGTETMFDNMTRDFVSAASKYLFFRPMLPGGEDVLIAGSVSTDENRATSLVAESEHLSCFIGGAVALAGRILGKSDDILTGKKLADGCAYTYHAFPTGMMPERYNMVPCEPQRASRCVWNETKWVAGRQEQPEWKEHLPLGFTTAKDSRYILRPEAIESVFVLYRITGDPKYLEDGWRMFEAIKNGTETEYANAAVLDVTQIPNNGTLAKEDYMESFWLAETLKYFYLLFSPPDLISLDEYVLNTEAHPFRRGL